MIYVKREIIEKMIEEAKKGAPLEVCGILAGRENFVSFMYPMVNIEKSEVSFSLDPKEQLKVMKDIRNKGLEMLAIYHSHPSTEARPSAKDISLAFYPECSYIIISLKERDNPVLRSFKIREGEVKEEEIKIVENKNDS